MRLRAAPLRPADAVPLKHSRIIPRVADVKLMYFSCKEGNFGDDLNAWIWDRLIPGWQEWDDDVTLFGVGTLINDQSAARYERKRVLVLGTGVGYGAAPPKRIPAGWDIRALRGPNSARRLGLDEGTGLIDPAVLCAGFAEFDNPARSDRPVFVPHHGSVGLHDWGQTCRKFNVDYVSPRMDAMHVIRSVAEAPLVIAESMHAAIFAEAFRIPWIPISIGRQFNAAKWGDVFESTCLAPRFHAFSPGIDRLEKELFMPRLRRYQRGFWHLVRRLRVESDLARIIEAQPQLGNGAELERRKLAYRRILKDVRRCYA